MLALHHSSCMLLSLCALTHVCAAHPMLLPPSRAAGLPPVPIGLLKADFTNIPEGTKLTVGSILFQKLDLPTEAGTAATCNGQETKAQTKPANGAGASKAARAATGAAKGAGGVPVDAKGASEEGDSFTRIDIRVGRIVQVRKSR